MEFEADRMTGLQLTDDKVVLPERDVILEEAKPARRQQSARASRRADRRRALSQQSLRQADNRLASRDGAAHAATTPSASTGASTGPNDAVVVIAGDVEPEQVLALAKETYGKVERNANIMPRHRPQEPPPVAARSLTWPIRASSSRSSQRDYLVPSFATAKRGESEALEVLAHIVGAGSNSRLYRALVVDKQIAVAAGAWYDSFCPRHERNSASTPRRGRASRCRDLEKAIDAVMAEVIAKGVTAEELERSKTKLIADAVYTQDSQASMARWYGSALTTGATVNDVNHWPDRIRAVTADQVQQAARKWLDHAALGHRLPDQRHQPAGGETLMIRPIFAAIALRPSGARRPPASRHDHRADRQPVRHQGLAGARTHGAAGRAQLLRSTAARPRTIPTRPAPPISPPTCSTRAPAISTARPFTSGWRATPSSCRFSVGRDYFRGSLRTLNEHRDEAFDLLGLALTEAALRRRRGRARAQPGTGRPAARD